MDDQEPPPAEPPDGPEPTEDAISKIVEEFAFRYLEDETLDLEAFCAEHPAELRDEIRKRCLAARKIQRSLSRVNRPTQEPYGKVGDFAIERELGRGAMGVVYLARQESLDREVALKVLALNPTVSVRAVKRFRREATAAAKLHHPNIVPVYSVGESKGLLYIAMEFIAGHTLAYHLRAMPSRAEGVPPHDLGWQLADASGKSFAAQVAELIARMAEALHYAHDQGIIHRDVKPENVMIDENGHPHLVDFGLAKDVEAEDITRTGDVAGTPYYMSPEQAMAKRVRVDHRTDVFSLGVVMYEILAQRKPFQGDTLQRILYEISFKEPLPVRRLNGGVPRDLETICLKAIEKKPDHRFDTAGEMAHDLRRFLNHESIHARPPSFPEKARRALVRHRTKASVAAVALIAAGSMPFIAGWWSNRQRIVRSMDPIRALAANDNVLDEPIESLADTRRIAQALLEEPEGMDREDLALVREVLEQRIEPLRKELVDEGMLLIERANDPNDLAAMTRRVDLYMRGTKTLFAAAALGGRRSQGEVEAWEPLYPRISLASDPEGAEVQLLLLNPLDGSIEDVRSLGRSPLDGVPVSPGLYRILVESGDAFAELTRYFDRPDADVDLGLVRLRPSVEVEAGMVLIEAGEFIFGSGPEERAWPYHRRTATLPAFWIDEREVSNREYKAFVDATGHRPPPIWPEPYDPTLDELPVVAVSFVDARAFGEWAGKRLPTLFEWERASRGTQGSEHPRDLGDYPLANYVLWDPEVGGDRRNARDPDRRWEFDLEVYRQFVKPVGSLPDGRSPDGLFHVLGNVREWTETLVFDRKDNNSHLSSGYRFSLGCSWSSSRGRLANLAALAPTQQSFRGRSVGFRCAKSVRP